MTKNISTSDLRTLLKGKPDLLLIDVLPKQKFDIDHIEGAQSIPFADSPNFLKAVDLVAKSKSRKIVVYCASEACGTSKQAALQLAGAGYTDVTTYEGGISAWRQQGSGDRPQQTGKPAPTGSPAAQGAKATDKDAKTCGTESSSGSESSPTSKKAASSDAGGCR